MSAEIRGSQDELVESYFEEFQPQENYGVPVPEVSAEIQAQSDMQETRPQCSRTETTNEGFAAHRNRSNH